MTHTEKHSELPWSYDPDAQCIKDGKGRRIGGLDSAHDDILAIRSVNALPSLVEALERAQTLLTATRTFIENNRLECETTFYDDAVCDGGCLSDDSKYCTDKIRAALALAKGE